MARRRDAVHNSTKLRLQSICCVLVVFRFDYRMRQVLANFISCVFSFYSRYVRQVGSKCSVCKSDIELHVQGCQCACHTSTGCHGVLDACHDVCVVCMYVHVLQYQEYLLEYNSTRVRWFAHSTTIRQSDDSSTIRQQVGSSPQLVVRVRKNNP